MTIRLCPSCSLALAWALPLIVAATVLLGCQGRSEKEETAAHRARSRRALPVQTPGTSPKRSTSGPLCGGRQRTRGSPSPLHPATCSFRDVTDETGIRFVHTDGSSGRYYIVEAMSAGLATFDYDRDGLIDIYFPNGAPLPGCVVDQPPRHALYKNLGNWRFRDVTRTAGVACTSYGLGIAIGDFDDDGWPDIYLNNFGPNVLYRNNGDGTFTDVTLKAGVARGNLVGAGACFFDSGGRGRLGSLCGQLYRNSICPITSADRPMVCLHTPLPASTSPCPIRSTGTTATAPSPT